MAEVLLLIRAKSDGSEQQVRCPVDGGLTLGRNPQSAAPLSGTGISRDHIHFQADGSALAVTDLSSNGTWLNGKRIPRGQPVALKANDCVEVPGYEIRFQIPSEQPAAAVAASEVPAEAGRPAARWWRSFTPLERFVALIATLSLLLVFLYLWS